MPIDINELRTYKGGNPDAYRDYMSKRFKDPTIVDQVLAKDERGQHFMFICYYGWNNCLTIQMPFKMWTTIENISKPKDH